MAETKKYYWLKLKRDFFKRHDIRIIEEMPNGKDYILFYLKMLLESIDHEGELRFSETIPYNEQMLSVITNTNIDIVKAAMKIFIELNMIEIFDDSTIYMAEVLKLTGSETAAAERKRKSRENKKSLPKCDNVTIKRDNVQKCHTEIEKEKEIDTDIELYKEEDKEHKADKPPRARFVPPTLSDVQDYCFVRNNNVDAQRFIDYYTSNGWKVGKNPMKDWKAAVRNWERSYTAKPATKTDKPETNNPFLKILMEEGETF
jgi:predicted phage replisome organizer